MLVGNARIRIVVIACWLLGAEARVLRNIASLTVDKPLHHAEPQRSLGEGIAAQVTLANSQSRSPSRRSRGALSTADRGIPWQQGAALVDDRATFQDFLRLLRSGLRAAFAIQSDGGAISAHTSIACIGATLSTVLFIILVVMFRDSAHVGSTDKENRDRSCLLDNAKFVSLVLVVFSAESAVREHVAITRAVDMIDMPMLSFISGLSAKGLTSRRELRTYLTYLVFPTFMWVFVVNPLIIIPLMYPHRLWSQLIKFLTLQTFNLAKVDLPTSMPYIWYLFPALIVWRGCSMLLAGLCQPILLLGLSVILSCTLGYSNLDDNCLKLPLNALFGYLPYFAVGLVFPLEAACRSTNSRTEPAFAVVAACGVLLWVSVIVPAVFTSPLPDPSSWYGSIPQLEDPGAKNQAFHDAVAWDYGLYWTRRLCKVGVDLLAVFVLIFLVFPRSKTFGTKAGRYTLYPYLFQQLASNYLHRILHLFHSAADAGPPARLAAAWLHLPWAIAVVLLFTSSFWRCLFSSVLEPVWLEKLLLRYGVFGGDDEGGHRTVMRRPFVETRRLPSEVMHVHVPHRAVEAVDVHEADEVPPPVW